MRKYFGHGLRAIVIGVPTAIVSIEIALEVFTYGIRETLYTWQGLIAGLLGLAAGSIAWFAAQRQIKATTDLELRREEAANKLFRDEIIPILQTIEVGWTKLDQIIAAIDHAKIRQLYVVYFTLDWHLDIVKRSSMETRPLVNEMDLVTARRATVLIEWLDQYFEIYEEWRAWFDQQDTEQISKEIALTQRSCLSHLHEAARRFDERLAYVFDDRIKAPVNWQLPAVWIADRKDENWPH